MPARNGSAWEDPPEERSAATMPKMTRQPSQRRVKPEDTDVEDGRIAIGEEKITVQLDKFEEPDHDIADQTYSYRHPMYRGPNGEFAYLKLNLAPASLMRRFGSGIFLYFRIVRMLMFLLLSMTIMAIPWVVVMNLGEYEDAQGNAVHFSRPKGALGYDKVLIRTTFGWLGQDWTRTPRENWEGLKVVIPLTGHRMDRGVLQYVIAGLDMLGLLCLMIAVHQLYKWASEKAEEVEDEMTVTINDYAVMVTGLPRDAKVADVHAYFSQYGEVAEVQLMADDTRIITYYKKFTKLVLQLGVAIADHIWRRDRSARVDKIAKRADAVSKKIANMRQRQDWKVICAFVTFLDAQSKEACMEDLKWQGLWGWVAHYCCMDEEKKFLNKHVLAVTSPVSPADLIFENLRFHWIELALRRTLATTIVVILLLGNVVLVSYLRSLSTRLASQLGTSSQAMYSQIGVDPAGLSKSQKAAVVAQACQNDLDVCASGISSSLAISYGQFVSDGDAPGWSADQIVASLKSCYDNSSCTSTQRSCYPCYCEGLLTTLTKSISLHDLVLMKSQCSPYLQDLTLQVAVQVLLTAFVVLMNIVLNIVITFLVSFEKYKSISAHEAAVCIKVALVQFINIAFTELLSSGRVDAVVKVLKGTPFEGLFLSGTFTDLGRDWYAEVGIAMHLTLLLCVVKSLVFKTLPFMLRRLKIWWYSTHAVTQQQLNDAYTGPEFKLSGNIADVLVLVMVAVVYGSSMPVLYFIATFGCWVCLKLDRRLLLRICQTPTRFGPHLAKVMLRLVLLAAVIHMAVAAWMHSHFYGIPIYGAKSSQQVIKQSHFVIDENKVYTESAWSREWPRLIQAQAFPFVALFAVIVAVTLAIRPALSVVLGLLDGVVGELLGVKRCLSFCCGCRRSRRVAPAPDINIIDAIRRQVLQGPTSYAITEQSRYGEAFRLAGKAAARVGLGHMTAAQEFRGLSVMSQAMVGKTFYEIQTKDSLRHKSFKKRSGGGSVVSTTGLQPKSRKESHKLQSRFSTPIQPLGGQGSGTVLAPHQQHVEGAKSRFVSAKEEGRRASGAP